MIMDLGTIKYILGIQVVGFKKGIVISYRKYTLGLLKAIRKIGAKPVDTHIKKNHELRAENCLMMRDHSGIGGEINLSDPHMA